MSAANSGTALLFAQLLKFYEQECFIISFFMAANLIILKTLMSVCLLTLRPGSCKVCVIAFIILSCIQVIVFWKSRKIRQ